MTSILIALSALAVPVFAALIVMVAIETLDAHRRR
jgi:hypothetical protein